MGDWPSGNVALAAQVSGRKDNESGALLVFTMISRKPKLVNLVVAADMGLCATRGRLIWRGKKVGGAGDLRGRKGAPATLIGVRLQRKVTLQPLSTRRRENEVLEHCGWPSYWSDDDCVTTLLRRMRRAESGAPLSVHSDDAGLAPLSPKSPAPGSSFTDNSVVSFYPEQAFSNEFIL